MTALAQRALAALCALCWLCAAPQAMCADGQAATTCHLDVTHSTISFHGHAFLHGFDGSAKFMASDVALGTAMGHGLITVDATSMSTGNSRRDRRMHAEVMASPRFGTITFALLRLEAADGGLLAIGVWTMHGVARPLWLPIRLIWSAAPQVRLSADLDILDWDIEPPTLLGTSVSKTVHVEANLTFTPDPAAAAVPEPPGPDLAGAAARAPGVAPGAASALPHPLGRVLLVAVPEQVQAALQAAARLAALVPASRRPLVVVTGEASIPGVWLDPHRSLARILQLPARPLVMVALDDAGRDQDLVDLTPTDADIARLAGLAVAATQAATRH